MQDSYIKRKVRCVKKRKSNILVMFDKTISKNKKVC